MKLVLVAFLLSAIVIGSFASGVASTSRRNAKCDACEALVQSVYDSASDDELMTASGFLEYAMNFGSEREEVREQEIVPFCFAFCALQSPI